MIVRYTRHNLLFRGSYEVVTLEENVPSDQAVEVAQNLKAQASKALGLEDITEEQAAEYRKKLDRFERRGRGY